MTDPEVRFAELIDRTEEWLAMPLPAAFDAVKTTGSILEWRLCVLCGAMVYPKLVSAHVEWHRIGAGIE